MKKILLLFFIFLLLGGGYIFAQNSTRISSASPVLTITSTDQKTIDNLKEKVANKVQELMKKNNKAIAGRVFEISDKNIKIKDNFNQNFEIKIDDSLTKFYKILGSSQKEIEKNNIKKNDYLIVSGVVNDKIVDANAIFLDQPFLVDSGKVIEIDKQNYILKIMSSDKTIYNLSIETSTKQQILNIKSLEIEKTGFSKIIIGDIIHFVCEIKGNEKENTYEAKKILIIPQEYFNL
ncbi:MAG: hypothetical protein N2593_03260 [Patescibacteria group bacterium]|nr:hypothetical protein [Patescibacteria group bacterium]